MYCVELLLFTFYFYCSRLYIFVIFPYKIYYKNLQYFVEEYTIFCSWFPILKGEISLKNDE